MSQATPKKFGGAPFYVIILLVIVVATYFFANGTGAKPDKLSDVINFVETGTHTPVNVTLYGYKLEYKYTNDLGKPVKVSKDIPALSVDRVLGILIQAQKD